jgi:hypothetical protein
MTDFGRYNACALEEDPVASTLPTADRSDDTASDSGEQVSVRRMRSLLFAIPIALYVAGATFPATFLPHGRSLDASWRFGVNVAAARGIPFGEAVNFTYGPLAFLISPLDIGGNLLVAVVFWFVVQVIFAGALLGHVALARRVWPAAAFAALYLCATAFDLTSEYHLVVVVLLVLSLALAAQGKARMGCAALGGALAGACLFIKFTLGVAMLGMLGAVAVSAVVGDRARWWRTTLPMVGGLALSTLVVMITNLGSPSNLVAWIRASIEISSGFSTAMAESAPLAGMSIVAAAVFVVTILLLTGLGSRSAAFVGIMATPALFIAFKHSYIRHAHRFFGALLIAASALVLLNAAIARRRVVVAVFGAVAVVAAATPVGCSVDRRAPCTIDGPVAFAGLRGFRDLGKALQLEETRRELRAMSELELRDVRLPETVLRRLRVPGVTVDVLPWELSIIDANDLSWKPNPALQLYNAATPRLDRSVADHFRSDDAPTYLLWQFKSIDGRHPFLDAPRTLRAVRESYELVDEIALGSTFVLKRRESPVKTQERTLGATSTSPERWVDVPRSESYVFARADLRPTLGGLMRRVFARVDPVAVEVRYESGIVLRARITPELASGGLLIGGLPPRSLAAASNFWRGRASGRVVAFRFVGPGLRSYKRSIPITWIEVPRWR